MGTTVFAGTYSRTLDEKHRIVVPKAIRDPLEGTGSKVVYLGPGTETTIQIFTQQTLEAMGEKLDHASQGPDQRVFSRLFFAQVQPTEIDSQGRIRLPPELKAWAKIESEVVLIGVRDHIEVWSASTWREYLEKWQSQFDEITDKAFRAERPSSQ